MTDHIKIDYNGRLYPFYEEPVLPLKGCGQVWTVGWDIPTTWAIDAKNQCWMDDAHGSPMRQVEVRFLLGEASDTPAVVAEIRRLLGRKPQKPSWIASARAAGWTPPSGWDESQYDQE